MAKRKKKSNFSSFLLGIIIIAGLCVIAYPTMSDWWNSRHQSRAIASYVDFVSNIDNSSKNEMLEEARAYNSRLEYGVHLNLEEEEIKEYMSILDISGTGIMGYIQIPAINVNLPIYHGTDEAVLQIAAGHISGTSFPIGGPGTHAVVSGHRGLPSAKLFTDLDKLGEGDTFIVTVLDNICTYEIDQIRIVLPEEVNDLAIEPEKDYMTLITCTPYGVNTHRMLVRGHRIENAENVKEYVITSEASRISPSIVFFGVGIPLVIIAMLASFISSAFSGPKKSGAKILEEMEKSVDLGGKKDEK